MSLLDKEPVKRAEKSLKNFDQSLEVIVLDKSARTAQDAATALGCNVGAIVKSLLFKANDSFILDNGLIKTKTNNSGGIQGGISNGMPITFSTAIKPTASIGKKQNTVNIQSMQEEVLELKGRHDPAIVHRVIHVINAITNYAILEVITRKEGTSWIK